MVFCISSRFLPAILLNVPNRRRVYTATTLCLGAGLLGGAAPLAVQAAMPGPLLVGAAVSLTEPLLALAPRFATARKLPTPGFTFASSGTLQQQIQKGAPIDVFIAAAEKPMNTLEKEGLLLPGTRRTILGNQLVLVVPARSPRRPLSFPGLGSATIRRIAIGDSTVPAGDYARQTLAYYQLTSAVQDKLVPLGSVRAVANAVAAGDVDAGIVYRSDAQNVANLWVVAAAPETSHAPIRYSAAVLRSSRQPALARAYVASLATPEASQVFRRYGLLPLAATTPAAGAAPAGPPGR
jgi:molybdate transport system substrate-binding protein